MRQRIGFFGGTFDPIHFGHLNLAIELMEVHQLDEVWVCPAQINPHKQQNQPTSSEHRLQMVKLALEGIPKFRLIDIELKRKGPSYTVDTLKELIKSEGDKDFFLMLGDDAIPSFLHWHKPEEIVSLVPMLIGQRHPLENVLEESKTDKKICDSIKKGLTPTSIIEISATDIRERLKKGLYCGHLVPAKVMDYIYQNRLYYPP